MKLRIFVDAAWDPRSREASWGIIYYLNDWRRIWKGRLRGLYSSSGEAEYAAIHLAFKLIDRLACQLESATIFTDSDLILAQLAGDWEARSPAIVKQLEVLRQCLQSCPVQVTIKRCSENPAHHYARIALRSAQRS